MLADKSCFFLSFFFFLREKISATFGLSQGQVMISDVVSPKHMFSSVKVKSVSKNLVTIRVLPKSLPDVKPKVEGGQGCIEFPAVFFTKGT